MKYREQPPHAETTVSRACNEDAALVPDHIQAIELLRLHSRQELSDRVQDPRPPPAERCLAVLEVRADAVVCEVDVHRRHPMLGIERAIAPPRKWWRCLDLRGIGDLQ